MPVVQQLDEKALDLVNESFDQAYRVGQAAIIGPDLDPDFFMSAHFARNHFLPTEGTLIYSGDSEGKAIQTRAPNFANIPVRPLKELHDLPPEVPTYLMDSSRIDQANVGGPKGMIPNYVLDTHVGGKPDATGLALLSDEHVATGSIILELARHRFGDDTTSWGSSDIARDLAGLRFGVYTDSGEDNYATIRDRAALNYMEQHMDQDVWKGFLQTPFFHKVQSLYEKGLRLIRVRQGFAFVRFEEHDLDNCRDFLGAVADRLLHHLNGAGVFVSGPIQKDEESLCCFALRLNKNHKAFDFFSPGKVMDHCKLLGGGAGGQINGQVWGGSVPIRDAHIANIQRTLRDAYLEHAAEVHKMLGGFSFDTAKSSL